MVAAPLLAGATFGGNVPVTPKPKPNLSIDAQSVTTTRGEVVIKVVPAPVRYLSALPLTASTFVPAPSAIEVEEDYEDIDFGDPNPFIVPPSWVAKFTNVDPRSGKTADIDDELEW